MDDLALTRTVERWARRRHNQRVLDEVARAVAIGSAATLVAGTLAFSLPGAEIALIPLLVLWIVLFAVSAWRLRAPIGAEAVAGDVDREARTEGLIRTAMAVEARRAAAGPEVAELVRLGAIGMLPDLEDIGAPAIEVPVRPMAVVIGCLAAGSLIAALSLVLDDNGGTTTFLVEATGSAYRPPEAEALEDASAMLEELQADPALAPEDREAAAAARDALAEAATAPDPRATAVALERARRALEKLDDSKLVSVDALKAARPEQVARALNLAVQRGDTAAVRRLTQEILRRTEAEPEAALRALGKSIGENLQSHGPAASQLRAAGQALEAQDGAGALAALADALGDLPEDHGMDRRRRALQDAASTVAKAREQALAQQRGDSKPGDTPPDGPPTRPGDGKGPSPVHLPNRGGGEGDGGGGSAKGGTEDLREGGTPGIAQAPEVRADAPGASDRTEGPDGAGARGAAGDGPGRDGEAPDGAGGGGSGQEVGGSPTTAATNAGTGAPTLVGAGGAAVAGGGQGVGAGGELDSPLLELPPGLIASDWVQSQWDGAGGAMAGVLRDAEAGGRSSLGWSQVHAKYAAIAEGATGRPGVPLSRRQYVQRYFQAIRPTTAPQEP